jgi:hypothetical protein
MIRCTTKHDDETQDQEADHSYDLDGGEDELGFSVDADGEDVQAQDEHDDDGDPNGWIVLSAQSVMEYWYQLFQPAAKPSAGSA